MPQQGLQKVTYKLPGRGRRAALCILLGAAIWAGAWLAREKLGLPQPFSLARKPKIEQKLDTSRASREMALSAHTLYALQLGAFTQESAARQLAQEFSLRGAAGYVYFDGEAYRVLAAGYATRAEGQAVQTRLNAQHIATYIHPVVQEAVTLRAGGTAAQVNALADALSYLDGLAAKLAALSDALDSREMAAEEAQAALLSEGATCAALGSRLREVFPEGVPGTLTALTQALDAISQAAQAAEGTAGAARTGAALKNAQLTAFFGLTDFCAGLEGRK